MLVSANKSSTKRQEIMEKYNSILTEFNNKFKNKCRAIHLFVTSMHQKITQHTHLQTNNNYTRYLELFILETLYIKLHSLNAAHLCQSFSVKLSQTKSLRYLCGITGFSTKHVIIWWILNTTIQSRYLSKFIGISRIS